MVYSIQTFIIVSIIVSIITWDTYRPRLGINVRTSLGINVPGRKKKTKTNTNTNTKTKTKTKTNIK